MPVEPQSEPDEPLSASEIGRYVYCARAWWLQRVVELVPQNQAALQRGRERHAAHGQTVRVAAGYGKAVRWLLLLALALGLIWFLSWLYR